MLAQKIRNGEYSLDQPQWNDYSPHLKELVKALLCVNPKDRISSTATLSHPWINSIISENYK